MHTALETGRNHPRTKGIQKPVNDLRERTEKRSSHIFKFSIRLRERQVLFVVTPLRNSKDLRSLHGDSVHNMHVVFSSFRSGGASKLWTS